MVNLKLLIPIIAFICFISCGKEDQLSNDNFTSLDDFFLKNQVPLQSYSINNNTGGSFRTPQGTLVTIHSNTFLGQSGLPILDNVTILFKDIYKKSDILLSNLHTMTLNGSPLKSGGEFYLGIFYKDSTSIVSLEKKITISQPASLTGGLDLVNIMKPYVLQGFDGQLSWLTSPWDSTNTVATQTNNYIFSIYSFNNRFGTGAWFNCDNSTYFNKYQQTILEFQPKELMDPLNTDVFLLFNDITTVIRLFYNGSGFSYYSAPVGLKCTMVAINIKDGALYSSFVPITITSNQVVNFTLLKTTTDLFKSQLKALD